MSSLGWARLHSYWNREQSLPFRIEEKDEMELSYELSLRQPKKAQAILDQQSTRIESSDRKKEFAYIRKALAGEASEREQFFLSLSRPEERKPEAFLEIALKYLSHPIREDEARARISRGLNLLKEIQSTADIFFPYSWIWQLLWGQSTPEAYKKVQIFLKHHPNYPNDLKLKILQASDLLRISSSRSTLTPELKK